MELKPRPPRFQRASYSRVRSSSGTSRADLSLRSHHEAHAGLARLAAELGVARLHRPLVLRIQGRVVGGHAEVGRALEDEEMRGLPRR